MVETEEIPEAKRERIASRLRALEAAGGRLTPEAVLEDAADPASPLHDEFEWDDASAAHQHRLDRARAIIRSVRYVVHQSDSVVAKIAYVRDPRLDNTRQGYVATNVLRSQHDLARRALAQELARVSATLARARDVADSIGLASEVDAALAGVIAVQNMLVEEKKTA